jgi:hypothetical protein
MGPSRQTTCYYCRAPLPVAEGVEVVDCQYCKTRNDLRKPAPQVVVVPSATATKFPRAIAFGVVALLIVGVAVFMAVGQGPAASRDRPAPSTPPTPLELDWVSESEFAVRGHATMQGQVRISSDGEYRLTLRGFPERTRWQVGERRGLVQTSALAFGVVAEVRDELGSVPVSSYRTHGLGPVETLVIELPSGREGSIELKPVAATFAILGAFEGVKHRRPLRFADEPEPGEARSLLLHASSRAQVYGPAETFAEVDLVAFRETHPEVLEELPCSFEPLGELPTEQTMQLKASEVRVYDRRTADLVYTERFSPSSRCPTMPMGRGDSFVRTATSREIEGWLLSLLDD